MAGIEHGIERRFLYASVLAVALACQACARKPVVELTPSPQYVSGQRYVEVGVASWYGKPYHGRPTASGERFDMKKLTAAHRSLPLGVVAKVTNLDNGRSVAVRINDRGPFVAGRVLDLSRGAAKKLDMVEAGLARVRIEIDP